MIQLDLQTLVCVLIVLSLAIGAPLAWISGPRRGTGALWYWAMGLLALASGSLLLVLREIIPPIVSIMFGNALIIFAVALLGNVGASLTREFLDSSHRWFFAVLTAPVLGLLYLTVDAIWPRVAYMAAVECYLVGQLAWQLRSSRTYSEKPQRKSILAFEILLWVYLGETLVRIVSTLALTPGDAFFQQSLISFAFLFAILVAPIGTCILIWHELDSRDAAVRIARSADIASGLRSQAVFMQLVDGRLASMAGTGDGSIALVRVRPSLKNNARLDPYEESTVYRKAGARIDQCLSRSDVLARVADDEFGVLFRGNDIARAVQALELALISLQSTAMAGNRGRYVMNGTAALIPCGPSIGSAAQAMEILHGDLKGALMGGVRVLSAPSPVKVRSAGGNGGR